MKDLIAGARKDTQNNRENERERERERRERERDTERRHEVNVSDKAGNSV